MPRVVTLSSVTLGNHSDLGCDFTLAFLDGDLNIVDTNMRRIIEPNQDIDEQCDNLDTWLVDQKGYPKITDADRQTIKATRAAADANPAMVAKRDLWIAEQEKLNEEMNPPTEPAPEETP